MENFDQYDTILYIDNSIINEDERYEPTKPIDGTWKSWTGYADADDPRLHASNAFGKLMQSELNSLSAGFSAEVTDLGKWVVVRAGYHNYVTGRAAYKTFLVVFKDKSDGIVLSTSNRWRSISGYSQAVSYIKSAIQTLKNSTSQKV